ncbi:ComEC/Rec2 family competence protein [Streptomyces sp. NPDC058045]|uniref:ComEC/Rec2 family competence protein n=1 Tax=Streptomyces sp. NPDC058045 TaxID=3346311 RepID=UPI0036EEB3DC
MTPAPESPPEAMDATATEATAHRPPVHRTARSPLGDPHPHQEAPADLRLVAPAVAAWAAAAAALDAPTAPVLLAAAIATILGLLLLRPRPAHGPTPSSPQLTALSSQFAAQPPPRPDRWPSRRPSRNPDGASSRKPAWRRVSVAGVLLCAAAAGASAVLHGADLHRGPVPRLARAHAHATLEVEITADPRRTAPRVTGDHMAPSSLVTEARVLRVTSSDGGTTATRTPVLLITDAPRTPRTAPGSAPPHGPAAPSARVEEDWAGLLPGARVRVVARLAPALAGDSVAAVARVSGGRPPEPVAAPPPAQRLAGKLRAGLREATDHLPPDARALLPGLVVGDTSRVPADLTEAFRATDLTHLLAVSGDNVR